MVRLELKARCNNVKIEIYQGDITEVEGYDAIVNPANSLMIMGGGLAGYLKKVAGDEIEVEARRHAPVPVGKAIVTDAGRLKPRIKFIIHAPTMERPAMRTTKEKVKRAAKAALESAVKHGIKSLLFPALGAGVGGLDAKDSMEAMLEAVEELLESIKGRIEKIGFVAYTQADLNKFIEAIKARARKKTSCIEIVD